MNSKITIVKIAGCIFGMFAITLNHSQAQNNNIGIGTITPEPNAILDVSSQTKGFLMPRLSTIQRISIANPPTTILPPTSDGLLVYDLDLKQFCYWNHELLNWECIGALGNTGPTGPQGLVGVAGPTGAQGIQGIQGLIGTTGPVGSTGLQGLAGSDGNIGLTGPTGPQGIAGVAGATGAQGIIGPIGSTGVQGPQGPTGLQGISGAAGAPGAQGVAGPIGPTGANGLQGATGPTGPAGPSGSSYIGTWLPLPGLFDATQTILPNSWSYYFNAVIPQTMTVTQVLMWSDQGSDPLRIGIFRGTASSVGPNTGSILVGQGTASGVSGPKIFNLVAESGQNLNFTAGESVCIGFAQGGTTNYMWAGADGPLGNTFAWRNTTDLEAAPGFNTNPQTGTQTTIRFVFQFQ